MVTMVATQARYLQRVLTGEHTSQICTSGCVVPVDEVSHVAQQFSSMNDTKFSSEQYCAHVGQYGFISRRHGPVATPLCLTHSAPIAFHNNQTTSQSRASAVENNVSATARPYSNRTIVPHCDMQLFVQIASARAE